MKKIILLLTLIALLSGCFSIGQPKKGSIIKYQCSDGTVVYDLNDCPKTTTISYSKSVYNVDEKILWEDFSIVVDKVVYSSGSGIPSTEYIEYKQPEGKLIAIIMTVDNLNKIPRNLHFGMERMITLIDDEGREFDLPIGYYGLNCSQHAVSIQPNMPKKDCIYFDIPKDAKGLKLKLSTGKTIGGIYIMGDEMRVMQENVLLIDLGI